MLSIGGRKQQHRSVLVKFTNKGTFLYIYVGRRWVKGKSGEGKLNFHLLKVSQQNLNVLNHETAA